MKKWILMGLIGIVTIGTFVFFTPIFVLLFGLCSVLFGVVALIRPSQVQNRRVQSLSHIRMMGIGFCMLGLGTSIIGGSLAQDFYQGDTSKNIASNFSFQDAPKSTGSDVSRPETEEEQPVNQGSSTQKSTTSTTDKTSDTTTTNSNSVEKPASTTTSPSTTTSTPRKSTIPTSDSHPGKGIGRDKKKP